MWSAAVCFVAAVASCDPAGSGASAPVATSTAASERAHAEALLRPETPLPTRAETVARWRVQAFVDGELRAEGVGISVDSDTIGPHGRGAGRTALELTLP